MKIAITGKMCSGKTTLSNYIQQIEPRFQVFSFGKSNNLEDKIIENKLKQ